MKAGRRAATLRGMRRGIRAGGVRTGERLVLACPAGRCGERAVLMGRQSLWYGYGRPEMFSCGGCGEILTLGHRVVAGEKGCEDR